MAKKNKYDEELHLLMSCLAESVAQMSDVEVGEEYGKQPGSKTKEVFSAALKDLKQQKLREARAKYDYVTHELSSRSYKLPDSKSERRALLAGFLAQNPDLQSVAFTAQHRELKDLTDSDIESFLRQLGDLGLLDTFQKGK